MDLVKMECWCAADNHNYMCHTCTKGFKIQTLIKQLLTKYQIFMKLPQISHPQKLYF